MAFRQFNPLNVPEHWERYWTKYPQGMTILESLFEWVSQVDEMSTNVNDWNVYLKDFVDKFDDNLKQEVTELLREWQLDGTLEIIINEALQTQIDDVQLIAERNIERLSNVSLDITDFGAVGDGSTDSTLSIQSAIHAAYLAGGGVVIVPPSTNPYLFKTLVIEENVVLKGTGGQLKYMDGINVNDTNTYYLIHNMTGLGGYHKNVCLLNLDIDGNGRNNPVSKVSDIVTFVGEKADIINCTLSDAPDSGIMYSGVKQGLCINNRINGGRDLGIYVNDGQNGTALEDSIISNNVISGFPAGGIGLKRVSQRVTVSNNIITSCGNGITLEQASTATDYSKNMIVSNNYIREVENIGIAIRESDYTLCYGNKIESFGSVGITVTGTIYSTISNNVIKTSTIKNASTYSAALFIADRDKGSSYNIITNNVAIVTNKLHPAIWIAAVSGSLNKNNVISDNIAVGSVGMRVDATARENTITGNILDGATFDLIYYSGAVNKVSNTLVNKKLSGNLTDFENAQISLGGYTMWIDTAGDLRYKNGSPTTPTDGNLVDKRPTGMVGTPTQVPSYLGQIIIDTANRRAWISVGLTNLDWVRMDNV